MGTADMLLFMSDYVKSLPDVDTVVVRMLRGLAEDGSSSLGALAPDERMAVLSSLCVTLMRATYHRLRFDALVDAAQQRAAQFHPRMVIDAIGKYIGFEALATLVAARSAVDEICYVAARRAGSATTDAEKISVSKSISSGSSALAELAVIRTTYLEWFNDVNEYRNALAHRGYDERLGVHASDSQHPQASVAAFNVLLLPDRASVARPRRPHEWTYHDGRRLEGLIADVHHGLLCVLQDIGVTLWGGTLPERGRDEVRWRGPLMLVMDPQTSLDS